MHRAAAVLILVAGLAVASPSSAPSSPLHTPASNGWIVFASDRTARGTGSYVLYRLEPVGGGVSALGELRGRQPAWSPDGSQIAFVDEARRLVVVRSDGTRARALTDGRFPARDPVWSPDGSRIAFRQVLRKRDRGDLVVVRATGSAARRITGGEADDSEPAWSPDGALIAFVSQRSSGDRELLVVRPDGRKLRALTSNEFEDRSPSWSPDGRRLVFVSGRTSDRFNPELWIMDVAIRRERRVQRASEPGGFPSWSDFDPSWSPDGNWLVYVSIATGFSENVFIVRPEGRNKIDLTPETRSSDLDPAWQPVCSAPGTPARDSLRGDARDERICGFAGGDHLSGGGGVDVLLGGEGADRLEATDGSFDVVGCGSGRDVVVADRRDLVAPDCERVVRR